MGYQVIFTAQADRDLEEVVRFLAGKSPSAARRLGHALLDSALALTQLPRRGLVVSGRCGFRRIFHRPWFLIFYRINESDGLIEVVRIWDARKDPADLTF